MKITARVQNAYKYHRATVATDDQERALEIPPKPSGYGSSANGGELLFLALATCYCNDIYREAAARGLEVTAVEVEVNGEFGAPGGPASDVTYRVRVTGKGNPADLEALARHTDTVAEIQNTLRGGAAVTLAHVEVAPAAGDGRRALDSLRAEFARWQALLARLSEEEIVTPDPASGWSVKDVVYHLYAWQQLSIARLAAARDGGEPRLPDWVTGPDPDDEALLEQFNATIYDTGSRQPWPQVYALWRDGFPRLLELAEACPEEDLMAAGKYPWLHGYALVDVLEGWREHHAEHYEALGGGRFSDDVMARP